MEELFGEVQKVLCNQLGAKEENVILEASLRDDLGADSLDAVEIAMEFEERYGIEITDEDIEGLVTVGNLVELVKGKIG